MGFNLGAFMGGVGGGMVLGQRINDMRDDYALRQAHDDAMRQAEDEAKQSGKTVYGVDAGPIGQDIQDGGGVYSSTSPQNRDFTHRQLADYEALKAMPDAGAPDSADSEYRRVFNAQAAQVETAPLPALGSGPTSPPAGTWETVSDGPEPRTVTNTPPADPGTSPVTATESVTALPSASAPTPTPQPTGKPGLASPGLRDFAVKRADKTALDIYADKYVPSIQTLLVKQGKVKEAEAFGAWAQGRKQAEYGRSWAKAATLERAGDYLGAINALTPLYNQMVPDGHVAEVVPNENGDAYTVNVRRERDGRPMWSHTDTTENIARLALGALSPMDMFNAEMKMQAAERDATKAELKVVGDVLVDTKTGRVVFDARQDKAATGYAGELQAAVKAGQIAPDKASKLYVDYLEKRASQTGGVTIQMPSMTGWETGPTGNRVAVRVGRDGQVSKTDTGMQDRDYIDRQVKDVEATVSKWVGANLRYGATHVSKDMVLNNARQFASRGMPTVDAIAAAMQRSRDYIDYTIAYKAAKTPEERQKIDAEALANGLITQRR